PGAGGLPPDGGSDQPASAAVGPARAGRLRADRAGLAGGDAERADQRPGEGDDGAGAAGGDAAAVGGRAARAPGAGGPGVQAVDPPPGGGLGPGAGGGGDQDRDATLRQEPADLAAAAAGHAGV